MARPVKVVLLGKAFTLQTDEDEAHVQRVAALVDGRLHELKQRLSLPEASLALLTALTLADDLEKAKSKYAALQQDVAQRAGKLRERLARAGGEG